MYCITGRYTHEDAWYETRPLTYVDTEAEAKRLCKKLNAIDSNKRCEYFKLIESDEIISLTIEDTCKRKENAIKEMEENIELDKQCLDITAKAKKFLDQFHLENIKNYSTIIPQIYESYKATGMEDFTLIMYDEEHVYKKDGISTRGYYDEHGAIVLELMPFRARHDHFFYHEKYDIDDDMEHIRKSIKYDEEIIISLKAEIERLKAKRGEAS